MIANLLLLGIRHRPVVSFLLVLMTLFAASGLPRLEVDTSFDSLIPADDPQRTVYQRVQEEFGSDNRTVVYVRDADLWSPEKLRHLDNLQRDLSRLSQVKRVDSVFSLRTIEGTRRDGLPVIDAQPVIPELPSTAEAALRARDRLLDNPLYVRNFVSEDGTATAIILSIEQPDEGADVPIGLYKSIEALLDQERDNFEALFQVGPPRIMAELNSALYQDFLILGPLSAAALVIAILVFLRSALVPIITSAVTIVWTFGVLGWLGVPLNILSAMIPSLIIVIGSTEDTHIMAAYYRELEAGRADARRIAIERMARHVGLPLLLTVLTTALGFASNLGSSIGLIQQFAIASTFAIVANGVLTMLLVPMLLSAFGSLERPLPFNDDAPPTVARGLIGLFRFSQDHFPLNTLAITAALVIFFGVQASSVYVTNDPLSYFPDDRPLIVETQRINEDLAGIKMFFVTLEAQHENAFREPANIARLAEIQQFMEKQGVYDVSISLADHLALVNREFNGGFAENALPQSRELISQYLLFFHRDELDSYVSHDFRRANIVVRHHIGDSNRLSQFVSELEEVAQHIAGNDIRVRAVGENLMVNRAAERLLVAQVWALVILLALIFVLMSIMFTSLKGGAMAMVPAVIPIVLMFGIMGFLDIPLNPGTAMVAVIAVGIAIDGTIHLLARYNELCRRTSNYVGAVHEAVDEVATPLIASSLSLALGFAVLLFSNFTVVAQFGALAAATMLISIVANLLITPILMARIRLVGLYQILSMSVDPRVLEDSPLFRDMSNYQRRKAILISELHEFDAGQKLVEQGTVGRSMFLILDGHAQVVRHDPNGTTGTRVLAELQPGDVFGEIGYIRAVERTADVIATTPVSALCFDYERLHNDLRFFPNIVAKLNFNISAILGERLADVLDAPR